MVVIEGGTAHVTPKIFQEIAQVAYNRAKASPGAGGRLLSVHEVLGDAGTRRCVFRK